MSASVEGPSRVVVGVDGSPESLKALKWAEHYADAVGAGVRVVVAWHWPANYGEPLVVDAADSPEDEARTVADKAVAESSLPEDRVEVVVVEGMPRRVLVDLSDGADVLVVGSTGHNAVERALLGSVSSHCVHHARVPVVVVR